MFSPKEQARRPPTDEDIPLVHFQPANQHRLITTRASCHSLFGRAFLAVVLGLVDISKR